jgi:hypothetical protein
MNIDAFEWQWHCGDTMSAVQQHNTLMVGWFESWAVSKKTDTKVEQVLIAEQAVLRKFIEVSAVEVKLHSADFVQKTGFH